MRKVLETIPPNYPVDIVYYNGVPVSNLIFSNINLQLELVYFVNEDEQLVIMEMCKIDGLAFGVTEEINEEDCCGRI